MQPFDFSPPSEPTLVQQHDALQKGLGRAWQWASSGCLADEALLAACLEDMRYDTQCEASRGDWLWDLVQTIEAQDRFRDPLFQALQELSDERSADQLCVLAGHYGKDGDEPFRTRLYEIVKEKPIPDSPWIGEDEIMQIDGEQALLFAARVRGVRLATIEWEWDDGSLAHFATGQFGEERVASLLKTSSDSGIQRFYESWQEDKQKRNQRTGQSSFRDRMRAITVNKILEAAKDEGQHQPMRGWGMRADEASLSIILEAIFNTVEPVIISKLLRVFSNRALPKFDSRLIDLCRHADEEVQRRAFNAIKMNTHAAIRAFALEQLEIDATASVVGLFQKNYEGGDENRILSAIQLPEDIDQLHWLLMDVTKVLENNPAADCSQLAVISYASTPCETCRFRAARLLFGQGVAPAWMIEECRYDSDDESRELGEENAEANS